MGGQVLEYEAKDILRKGIAQGLAEGHALGHAEGHAEGRAEGLTQKLLTQIRKKLDKNQRIEEIAAALEESVETIETLIKEYHLA